MQESQKYTLYQAYKTLIYIYKSYIIHYTLIHIYKSV